MFSSERTRTETEVAKQAFSKSSIVLGQGIMVMEQNRRDRNKNVQKQNLYKKQPVQQNRKNKEDDSICPVNKKCGGCKWLGLSYEKQLKKKQKRLEELLREFGKTDEPIGMEQPYHYRHKVHAVFGEDRKHNIISGTYEENSHRLVPVESCLLEDETADRIIATVRDLMKSFRFRPYNEDTGFGLFRHILIRCGYHSKEIMVVLVLSGGVMPSKKNFVKALTERHPEITTIVLNVNNKRTSMILGDKEEVLYGKGYIEDTLCSKVFKISPKSFYQVNPCQTEKLYGKAIEFAGLTGKETVFDAYCGTGTIGIIAADKAKQVIGVELNKAAVADAIINAGRNNVNNIRFYEQDAGKFMLRMAQEKKSVDVVLMDPPRSGSDEVFLQSVVTLSPKKIVYVSCNPETLARDLKFLTRKGYRMERAVGVDMFPWTESFEAVVLLGDASFVTGSVPLSQGVSQCHM